MDILTRLAQQNDAPTLAQLDRQWHDLLDQVYRGYVTLENLSRVTEFKVKGLEKVVLHVEDSCQQMQVILAIAKNNFGQHLGSLRKSK